MQATACHQNQMETQAALAAEKAAGLHLHFQPADSLGGAGPECVNHMRGAMADIYDIICNDLEHERLQVAICCMPLQTLDLQPPATG